jgi:hypothetical protein
MSPLQCGRVSAYVVSFQSKVKASTPKPASMELRALWCDCRAIADSQFQLSLEHCCKLRHVMDSSGLQIEPWWWWCWAQIQIYPDQIRRFKTILTLDRSWRWREIAAHNPLEQTRRASSCCIVSANIEGNKDKIDLECHVVLDMFGWCNDDCRLA